MKSSSGQGGTPPMRESRHNKRLRLIIEETQDDVQEHEGDQLGDLRRLWREYLSSHRKRVVVVLVALIVWASVPYCFALTHKYLIDRVLGPKIDLNGGDAESILPALILGLWLIIGANFLLHILNLIGNAITAYLTLKIGRDVAMKLRERLYIKLDSLHMGYYDSTQAGRIVARVQSDVTNIQNTITRHLAHLLIDPIKLTVGFGVLFWMDWRLARILAVAAPLYAIIFLVVRPRIRANFRAQSRINSRLYGLAAERLGAIQVLKAFGKERRELGAFNSRVHDGVRLAQRGALYRQGLALAASTVSAVAIAVILMQGLSYVRDGLYGVTLGLVVAFYQLAHQVFQPIQSITTMGAIIQTTKVSLRRVFKLLDEPCDDISGHIRLTGMTGKIRFDHIGYQYPTQSNPALRDVNFDIKAGEHVAIMGPSGSGKSSLFNLLLRFYEPQQGNLYVGGVNIVDTDVASLRRHVRYVQQEPFIFSGSIAQNMSYGCPDATQEEIESMAKQVEMHDFIMGLPEGYETIIGENGVGLSGGQRQRMALATALLTRPEVLLLDDTTSALDAETEARIRVTLRNVQDGRTSLIITQRIATARSCDHIVVLEDGVVTQQGTHETLSNQPGFYRRICEQQEAL
jgi:ABC-type multidrug transport system fused ATPase/permease subunit